MAETLYENATLVTVNSKKEVLENHSLLVRDDKIAEIGPAASMAQKYKNVTEKLDCEGKAIFPGLVNTHNHLFQTLLKGLGDDMALSQWLSTMTFPSGSHLEPEDAYQGARLGVLEGLRSGTTTMLDYMYPHPTEGLSDGVIKAFQEMKIRGVFGRGMMNTGEKYGTDPRIMQPTEVMKKDCIRVLDKYHNTEDGRITVWLAPAAVWSNSEENLRTVWELAQSYKTGFTVHISETPFDRNAAQDLHGLPDVEVLEKYGIVGPNVLMVHCVHLTDRDIRMAKYYDMKVSHNPCSNMYLASGVPRIPKMLEAGLTVGVASDGPASNNAQDMVEILKFTALLQKVHTTDPTSISADKVLEMATIDGARAIGMDDTIGSLDVGKKADFFVYNPFLDAKSTPMFNPVSTLVYSGTHKCVETVVVDGNLIIKEGDLVIGNEETIIKEGSQAAYDLAKRAGTLGNKYREWKSIAF